MVRQYYVPQVTQLSERELQSVFQAAEAPVSLLGGWAVHLLVNPGFQDEFGRDYIGSRDIDIGVHINPSWTAEELHRKPVGQSLTTIHELGYTESRFGFVQNFHRETQERISEDKATEYDMHEIFQVYIDVIADTAELAAFRDAFGFTPPAEPLLRAVFEANEGEPLARHVSWPVDDNVRIASPALLAAMKILSLPDRDKSHKQVKDVADLHALIWYAHDYTKIKPVILDYITDDDLHQLDEAVDKSVFENAADLLQVDPQLITESIQRLYR